MPHLLRRSLYTCKISEVGIDGPLQWKQAIRENGVSRFVAGRAVDRVVVQRHYILGVVIVEGREYNCRKALAHSVNGLSASIVQRCRLVDDLDIERTHARFIPNCVYRIVQGAALDSIQRKDESMGGSSRHGRREVQDWRPSVRDAIWLAGGHLDVLQEAKYHGDGHRQYQRAEDTNDWRLEENESILDGQSPCLLTDSPAS